ncbi:MAG: glutathione binding-like protein, partial [Burkholderiaceae bacterium]
DLENRGYIALGVMDRHLSDRDYFAGERLSIADLALFAYTHKADEGGFDVAPYPSVVAWLARVAQAPGVSVMLSP